MDKIAYDKAVRLAAFDWFKDLQTRHGEVLPHAELKLGFNFGDAKIHVLSRQGIFKPASLDYPLTIVTSPKSPYNDSFSNDGMLNYAYRAGDRGKSDNEGLRQCMLRGLPLIYLHGVAVARYLALMPVYIHADNPSAKEFVVGLEDPNELTFGQVLGAAEPTTELRRSYRMATAKVRIHQRTFRERVLDAYASKCSICRLKHREMLDAAHILPDAHERGEPIVSNGLSLCKIHHSAYDQNILGISPDRVVKIRTDILEEVDGPMLKYGIQEMDGVKLTLPNSRTDYPDAGRLEERYDTFKSFSL